MKNKNLVTELKRVEFSTSDDKISFEQHSYNGFLGIQGSEAYYNHLENLYNEYVDNIRENVDNLLFNDRCSLLAYLNDKIILFDNVKLDYELKNYMDWNSYIISCEKHYKENIKNNLGAKNEYQTAKFFKEMTDVQMSFIEKAIKEMNDLYNNYNDGGGKTTVEKPKESLSTQNKSLSEYVDDYFSRYSDGDTLTNKDLAYIFDISRPTIDEWKEQGKFIEISEMGKRPILYSKEDVKNNIKNGILTDRLTDINKR
ncbi:hypothetical protein [Dysgonomonas sp. 511]|uniref:hypothetical protein n=1 Tax=Dysgonomonas sp. 511 TaxID=2302930 RepID=UPI0013D2980F|nr:hypothetical protein [Dysgonomonas sp. 511]NDV78760.1 hypothetical protein [Dysgonomonas sp. 511]